MSLLSQSKREAKRLFSSLPELVNIINDKDYSYDKAKNFFYKLKGFKDFSSFKNIVKNDENLTKSTSLLDNIPNSNSNSFNKQNLLLKEEVELFPLIINKAESFNPPIIIKNQTFSAYNNALVLDNENYYINDLICNKNTIFITDNHKLSQFNSKILSIDNNLVTVDPLNPLIGDIFSIKYFFGNEIYLWVNEILTFIKQNNSIINIKQLEKIFYLPNLIDYSINYDNEFPLLKKYLNQLFINHEIAINNIDDTILSIHESKCSHGIIFAQILKYFPCFQSQPNCNFYTHNESFSILLDNTNNLNYLASKILLHNIFKCTSLINYPYSSIVVNCSLSFFCDLPNHNFKKTIFVPNINDFKINEFNAIKNSLFLKSETFFINLSLDIEQKYLPLSFINIICYIENYPIEYRKCNKFNDLNINKILNINDNTKYSSEYKYNYSLINK